jgi:hypothetical protein
LLHGDKMGNGEEEKQPLLLHPAVVARPRALLHRCLPRRRKGWVKQRGKAERMTTGATGENNSVSREGQFRLFSCSVGHKGLHWVVNQSSGTNLDVFIVLGPIWAFGVIVWGADWLFHFCVYSVMSLSSHGIQNPPVCMDFTFFFVLFDFLY